MESKNITSIKIEEDFELEIKSEIWDETNYTGTVDDIKTSFIMEKDTEMNVSSVKIEQEENETETNEIKFETTEQNEFISFDIQQEYLEDNDNLIDPLAYDELLQEQESLQKNAFCKIERDIMIVCNICNKSVKKSNFSSHKLIHTVNKPTTSQMHTANKSNTSKIHTANKPSCLEIKNLDSYHSKENVLKQLVKHTDKKPYVCDTCKNTFMTKNDLMKHLFNHLQNYTSGKPYTCKICKKAFRLQDNLDKHKCGIDKRYFRCHSCKLTFKSKEKLAEHKTIHPTSRRYECLECNTNFKYKDKYDLHMLKHNGVKNLLCNYCEKSFTDENLFLQHIRIHNSEKPYECNICQNTYKTNKALMTHKRTHTIIKPYMCNICTKSFKHENLLKKHLNTHTTGKQHKCPLCSKIFLQKSSLCRHKYDHISCKKRIPCDFCEKSYTDRSNLATHIKKEHGLKSAIKVMEKVLQGTCKLCGKQFYNKNNYQLHTSFCAMRQDASDKISIKKFKSAFTMTKRL